MPAQALYRKWRPQLWEEVVGQEHVVQTLRNALRTDHIAHAYLFAGPRGCGKTTSARLVAKALNCLNADPAQRPDNTCAHCLAVNEGRFLDLIEIDGASNNSVEDVRELRDKINFLPSQGRYKIYIIDEVHMLSLGAFNALLKTLEEPPAHAIFILATTEIHKIPPTVSSRCQRFEFRRIPVAEIVTRLKTLCVQEGLTVDEAALELVARQATGALRDAISLLDQLVASGSTVTLERAQELLGVAASLVVQRLVEAIAAGDTAAGLDCLNEAVDAGADPRQLARQTVDYLRGLLMVRLGNAALVEAAADVRVVMARQAERFDVPALLRAIRAFNSAAGDIRGGWQPQLPLELAVVECTTPVSTPEPAAVAHTPTPVAPRVVAGGPQAADPAPLAPTSKPAAEANPAPVAAADLGTMWKRLLALVRERDKPTEALLRSCAVAGFEGNTLRLSTQAQLVHDKLTNHAATRQMINTLLTEVMGMPCGITCQMANARPGRKADSGHVPAEGMVATALRDLGGEIAE